MTGVAYTNNDLIGGTGTTLVDLNTSANSLAVQSPPATGLLVTTGALGVDPALNSGLDIYSAVSGGRAVSNQAFATIIDPVSGTASEYWIDLLTGAASRVGDFPLSVSEIAIALRTAGRPVTRRGGDGPSGQVRRRGWWAGRGGWCGRGGW